MTNQEAKEIFNKVIENAKDADQVAELEVLREYFTNADFRAKLHDFVYEQNRKAQSWGERAGGAYRSMARWQENH